MKLTLACIAGNAEKYITRFLDSFQPWFDEVVVVRAIGDQKPDQTLDIAAERGCVIGEYINIPDIGWPHVDDFAAARNKAFDLATGDFIMWADMDDLLEGGQYIREELAKMPPEAQALSVLYDVRDDGIVVRRERIIRAGAAKWVNPIHEQLDFGGECKTCETNKFQIIHAPIGNRKANDERNLRILESIVSPTGSQRFHKTMSLRAVGRIADCIKESVSLLTESPPDMGTAEIYEVAFTVAQLVPDDETRAKMMLHALQIDPARREAYGDLAMVYISQGQGEKALALIQAMQAIDMPNPKPWNTRPKYYGFVAPLLHGAALRACDKFNAANTLERNHFIRNGAKISLVHATRGRPVQAAQARWKWLDRAKNPDAVEHIFGLDMDDETAGLLAIHRHVFCRGNGGPVDGWNRAAEASSGKVIIQLSDDWEPPLHWDEMVLDAIGDLDKPSVLAISDGHRKDDLMCMAILTRARYEQQGYMFHPEFFSMYSDDWFSRQAFNDGVVIDARGRIVFEHLHPAFGKAEMDETYARSNDGYNYATGKGIMQRLASRCKVSSEMDGWFDFRNTYDLVAKLIPDGETHVEVGVWKGKSIAYIYDRIEDLGKKCKVIGIDHFQGDDETGKASVLDEFVDNMGTRMVRHYVGDSAEQAKRFEDASLFSVFIDGAHDEESATRDIAAWLPKVKDGGIFAGHDIDSAGVRNALKANGISWARLGRCWIQTKETNE